MGKNLGLGLRIYKVIVLGLINKVGVMLMVGLSIFSTEYDNMKYI